jgi:hypothetical protein
LEKASEPAISEMLISVSESSFFASSIFETVMNFFVGIFRGEHDPSDLFFAEIHEQGDVRRGDSSVDMSWTKLAINSILAFRCLHAADCRKHRNHSPSTLPPRQGWREPGNERPVPYPGLRQYASDKACSNKE